MYVKKFASFCQVLKEMHTEENWLLFFCLADGYMRVLFVHSFYCLRHFENVCDDDDDDDRGGEQQGEPSGL